MRKWHAAVCSILIWMMPTPTTNFRAEEMTPMFEPKRKTATPKDLAKVSAAEVTAPKVIPNSISGFYGQLRAKTEEPPRLTTVFTTTTVSVKTADDVQKLDIKKSTRRKPSRHGHADGSKHPVVKVKVTTYAGVPTNLSVVALPLDKSDHELQLNVSWLPSSGVPAKGYAVDVTSVTDAIDCKSDICYQAVQNTTTWILIPPTWVTVVGGPCSFRPGCTYLVKLTADPWDGFTAANLTKELGECEAGVCSCAHSPRLPAPVVSARTVTINNTLYSDVSWYLPTPREPQRLPPKLGKQSYIITLHKQMPILANKAPYFKILENRTVHVNIGGLVFEGDITHSERLPISLEMTREEKIIAKVRLEDARGCLGPAGIATVFEPATNDKLPSKSKLSVGVYAILGALIGAWAIGAVFVLSARVVKRVLKSFRPAPVSAPLEPLGRRPAWFPLQLRT